MKLSMMTLGCPGWDLETICRRAGEYGYDGVDFRGIQDELDVTKLAAFTTDAAQTVKLMLSMVWSPAGSAAAFAFAIWSGEPPRWKRRAHSGIGGCHRR